MIVIGKALSRRTFLRGAGVALGLPLLDAMIPAASTQAAKLAAPCVRLAFVYIPMGAHLERWTPKRQGTITELSPTLASLTSHLPRISVLSNLELKNAYSAGNHATSNAAFLSAARAKMTEGSDYELGVTVDQIAAKAIGGQTLLPSLELAMDSQTSVGNCDNGYACVYQNNLSWSSPTSPLPAEAHPRAVFERLFGSGKSPERRQAELRRDASILDWVREDIASLRRRVGPDDREKVGEYLESVREVERRIQIAERRAVDAPPPDADRPADVPADYADHARLMFDLQALAMRADLTRVITFQLARETSNRTYPEIGVTDPHHPVSHHGNDPAKLDKLAKINAYHVSLLAYYLDKLKATRDGQGTLLDNALVLCGSGMGNPDVHDHVDLPILVAGSGAGTHIGGRHIRYARPTPLANLHLSLLDKVGVRLDSFADSSGRLNELYEPLSL